MTKEVKKKAEEAQKKKVEVEVEEEKTEKAEKKKKVEKKEKKSKKGLSVALIVAVVLVAGVLVAKTILTKTTVATETVKLSDDARGFANYFKEYLLGRVRAQKLFDYGFRNLSSAEILDELTDLNDEFSKVSRGVAGNYRSGEYKELAEVMASDSALYLTAVRELRTVMTSSYGEEADRQLAFMRKVEETTEGLRSALYVARAAFGGDVQGLSSKGVILFDGQAMVEVGEGVINILVGNLEAMVTAVTTDDIGTTVKAVEAQKLFGYVGSRVVKLGEGLTAELEPGWVKEIKAEVKLTDADLTTTKISTVMKNVWQMDEELKAQGIKGLVETEKRAMEEELNEVVKGLMGK